MVLDFLHYFAPVLQSAHKKWEDNNNLKRENLMEHINRIELQGHVGTVRTNVFEDRSVANFSVATEYFYKNKDGSGVSETTWHNVVAWSGKDIADLNSIVKGAPVYVCGRLRLNRYTNPEGVEKQVFEIIASKVRILNEV